jgi:DNA-binding MarR family transcriptional regulator
VYLSGSRTTRLVDELAASGLIRKTRSPADARGIDVTLTATGLARLQAAIARALE